jgi:hypothetical protein
MGAVDRENTVTQMHGHQLQRRDVHPGKVLQLSDNSLNDKKGLQAVTSKIEQFKVVGELAKRPGPGNQEPGLNRTARRQLPIL